MTRPVYAVGRFGHRIGCLVIQDNGQTWNDFAMSKEMTNIYAIGGARSLTSDGSIIGTFTDQISSPAESTAQNQVHFFRIRTKKPQ